MANDRDKGDASASPVFGDAGRFMVPLLGIDVPLYYKRSNAGGQKIVDAENSALLCLKFKGGCDYIADHAHQGFNKIKGCTLGMAAFIQTEGWTQQYMCVATSQGTNTKSDLVTVSGLKVSKTKWADLCCYCCNDETGKSISMIFFRKGARWNHK